MEVKPTSIPGCYEIQAEVFKDQRGCFTKIFQETWFSEHGLRIDYAEEYYTISRQRVLRGLHFQLPPHDHAKLVCCISGKILDVAVDLRRESPTYGQYVCIKLGGRRGNLVYLETGLAHGFYTLSKTATLLYNVTSIHIPTHDTGILWSSVGIPWPDDAPILSERDQNFMPFANFKSPFLFKGIEPGKSQS